MPPRRVPVRRGLTTDPIGRRVSRRYPLLDDLMRPAESDAGVLAHGFDGTGRARPPVGKGGECDDGR
jgi:hypothetical protein